MIAPRLLTFLSLTAALLGSILAGEVKPVAAKLFPGEIGDLNIAEQDYLSHYISRSPAGFPRGLGENLFTNDQYSLRGLFPNNAGSYGGANYGSFYRSYAQFLARLFGTTSPSYPRHFNGDFGSRF